ncbi:UDP-N-acetyl-D-mannosaminuronic acid dehydrogenase [Halogranum gelatinilyticum]|uniref:UDP-N-acetyl-D-mannosamine dehydrogenase n=1 Tax=Halogranum gelatinilyticum TaxID=660521 RepID=A0A1G9X920_9EURY|nr:nucleotide sugar dehydrogenase [Halogranum gelatinilyticum]SDM92946.1 UDP-N-acetyl-D-mannosaminuronic acid dehydrogenase [Halogranum gelatinilyticum]
MTDICIHGLGYIGLPTATIFAHSGYDVVGFDTNPEVVSTLRRREVHFDEPGLQQIATEAIDSERLKVKSEPVSADIHIICVPTPFDDTKKQADLGNVAAAGRTIGNLLKEDDLVILESTVPPTTTEEVLQPQLEKSGLVAGRDFGLAHCPETVLPGNMIAELRENDRVIGGIDRRSTERTVELYDSFVEGEIRTTENPTTAEFAKLAQNTFRDTNIALANELAMLADEYDIDSRKAIQLSNHHPRVNIHHPGPGVGGHCLPVDPWFLGQESNNLNLVSTAREINDSMSNYTIELLGEELGTLSNSRIAVLGVAYKGNVDDTRNSPGLKLARELQARKSLGVNEVTATDGGIDDIDVRIHDPCVSDQTLDLVPLDEAVRGAEALVLTTDHTEYAQLSPTRMSKLMDGNLILDTMAHLNKNEWSDAGFNYRQI